MTFKHIANVIKLYKKVIKLDIILYIIATWHLESDYSIKLPFTSLYE